MLTLEFVLADRSIVMKKFEKATIAELDIRCTAEADHVGDKRPCYFDTNGCNTNENAGMNPCSSCNRNPANPNYIGNSTGSGSTNHLS